MADDNKFWQALSDSIERAVNLRIVTLVGDAAVSGTLERMQIGMPPVAGQTIVTDINIALGDITYIVSDKLLGADYADLRNAHQDSVKQAQDIVARNVEILISVAKQLGDDLSKLVPPSSGPIRTAGQ
jgi:hypothetical protein